MIRRSGWLEEVRDLQAGFPAGVRVELMTDVASLATSEWGREGRDLFELCARSVCVLGGR
jgi:hypothetical protein